MSSYLLKCVIFHDLMCAELLVGSPALRYGLRKQNWILFGLA